MRLQKLQRGDTIIEVMLAMSVIALVLGSSYAIANRSTRIGREAQERTEALKEVETQVERLKTVASLNGNPLVDFPTEGAFCIAETESGEIGVEVFNGGASVDVDTLDNREGYPDGCYTSTDGRYALSITRPNEDDYLFEIRARW